MKQFQKSRADLSGIFWKLGLKLGHSVQGMPFSCLIKAREKTHPHESSVWHFGWVSHSSFLFSFLVDILKSLLFIFKI